MPKSRLRTLGRVGALIESPAAYPHLSGEMNLWLLESSGRGAGSRRQRRQAVREALDRVGLGHVGDRPVKAYSLGMRQRLGLASALIRRPELLVLDEPTNGLDPQGIREIRALLLDLHRDGTTVFVSSHLLAEIEQMCTRVGVLDRGRLVVQDALDTLRAPTGRVLVRTPDAAAVVSVLDGRVEHREGDRLLIRAPEAAELNALLVRHDIRVAELRPERRTLEEVVLAVTEGSGDVR
jgi:ABC-2 type transport system ATP-binding protein